MRLVADIGGTNARIALARQQEIVPETEKSFRNDDFDGFVDLARHYLFQVGSPEVAELVVAVAGPVWETHAKLTNRDWHFDISTLSRDLGIASAVLINDLTALGHALPGLGPKQLVPIHRPAGVGGPQRQSLVVGIGTGFNVCPVLHTGDTVQCLQAEFGHVSLPQQLLDESPLVEQFRSVEECFSGRGYRSFLDAGGTEALYASLVGHLARELVLAFMPTAGLYFNGGVARAILTSEGRNEFIESYAKPFSLSGDLSAPVFLIDDDYAALTGCARVQTNRLD